MLRRISCVLAAGLLCSVIARAQFAGDSTYLRTPALIASGALLASGSVIHFAMHDGVEVPARQWIQDDLRQGRATPDISSVARFAPAAAHLSLGLAGVNARHSFGDRAIESALAHAFGVGTAYIAKRLLSSERPDGSDMNSFPSGHALFAFTGAELLCLDYGWGWGAGGYAVALYTGAERLWGDRHWLGDVPAGAGLGMLSAHIGAWLLQPFKELFGLPALRWDGLSGSGAQMAFLPGADPYSGTPTAGVSILF